MRDRSRAAAARAAPVAHGDPVAPHLQRDGARAALAAGRAECTGCARSAAPARGGDCQHHPHRDGWPDERIRLYGPGTDSGTFDYFTGTINGKEQASRPEQGVKVRLQF